VLDCGVGVGKVCFVVRQRGGGGGGGGTLQVKVLVFLTSPLAELFSKLFPYHISIL